MDNNIGKILKISGPLVVAENLSSANIYDVVYVSDDRLVGEVIEIRDDKASIQVYEETSMLLPGAPVYTTGSPLSVELGPGLLEGIFDGIQRPLKALLSRSGAFITRGIEVTTLDREKSWSFNASLEAGDKVVPGDILGTVAENTVIEHRIMVPTNITGEIVAIESGDFTILDSICTVKNKAGILTEITMLQKWPVRKPRPVKQKIIPSVPMVTGQRIIDTFFPVPKGGTACVPGPFGSGKTVVQHQLAKWADVEIVVYVGCGERGNEMTDVLNQFPKLKDPKTGETIMRRTVLIANTSNMPVSAREASIYTGITIAEYYRDMGYSVALMADSTSRWAEALREMSGRLEEMPGEEGYPAYLSSRLAAFYERAGAATLLGKDKRVGSLTAIGAVSPPGGDLSEPVTQATLRVAKVFWGLDAALAHRRHFPAINWLESYSLYLENIYIWLDQNITPKASTLRQEAMSLLQREAELEEVVSLVGYDALSEKDQLTLETARSIREDFLQQNSFMPEDEFTSLEKQFSMLSLILHVGREAQKALEHGVYMHKILSLPIRERITRIKFIPEDSIAEIDHLEIEITKILKELIQKEGN